MTTTPPCLPEYLAVPLPAAATFHVVGDYLSARDVSFAVAALWLAANTSCRQESSPAHAFRIPDNGLRSALGQIRRDGIDAEDARQARLAKSTFRTTGHEVYPAPVAPLRHNLDDKRTWHIHDDLVETWRVEPGQPVVYLPLVLLQKAKSRFSVEAYLHAMSAALGTVPFMVSVTARAEDRVTLKLNEDALKRLVGAPDRMTLHRVRTEVLPELDKDLPAWGEVVIEPAIRTTATPKHPRGRFLGASVTVVHPPLAELAALAEPSTRWIAPVRTSVPGWEKKPPRPRHLRAAARRPLPAPIADVVYIPEPEPVPVRYDGPRINSDEDVAF
ncbi:MAG TPA: hypothetical protein VIL88_17855 [Devosia sp.]|jgi:hypothetical protein|uniref:hypothetical protein n=1 Tax=Devosia sp. TaxID=1871048 RepID=UPI002F92A8E7